MKKYVFMLAVGAMTLASCSAEKGGISITVPADAPKQLVVNHFLVADMLTAKKQSDLKTITDTIDVVNGKAHLDVDKRGAARYIIEISDSESVDMFTQPDETLIVDIEKLNPLTYSVTGTTLMEDITKFQKLTAPFDQEYAEMSEKGNVTPEEMQAFMRRYDKTVEDFVKQNPKSQALPYAMFYMQGEALVNAYNAMTPEAKASPLYPIIQAQVEGDKEQREKEMEMEKQLKELSDGRHMAPGFTLKDLQGKNVSLSDFRGKWVILDFWGTWCGWCVKGIPRLKEAYKEYAGKVEVIGIDCNEPEEAWRAGVARFELPWVNVYNPKSSSLTQEYLIQGFPTKVIVDPEGRIADITIGEDPSFYSKLATLVNGN